MSRRHRYRFVIDEAFTPETLPMSRLAQYMADVAMLLGEPPLVHFVGLEDGSAVLVQEVEHEAYPKVRQRVYAVHREDGPQDATRAYESLNRLLAEDNASGTLLEDDDRPGSGAQVLMFPGAKQRRALEYGPVAQFSTLQGVVIVVGGERDPVPVHLQDGDVVHNCIARRTIAKQLAQYIFGQPLRVGGQGRWFRDALGRWTMRRFQIAEFAELRNDPLSTVIADIRSRRRDAPAPPDALERLIALRRDVD